MRTSQEQILHLNVVIVMASIIAEKPATLNHAMHVVQKDGVLRTEPFPRKTQEMCKLSWGSRSLLERVPKILKYKPKKTASSKPTTKGKL
ncbi:hypothetical protein CDAR_461561 [Caerostris darwini]|uniref:Uncharacterized protein n=1 Tax=Caerostris darwini TaxID=1538125 RepID=A0AAV4M5Q0_9ARAC|nr:hypothetical protein CDAR_461561 [Caerostris darwini]